MRRTILEALDFGRGVAESDVGLERYFVRTPRIREILRHESQLILGTKGSGKSAIARTLRATPGKISEIANLRVIPIFSANESTLFPGREREVGPEDMRRIWSAFIVSVLVENTLYSNPSSQSTDRASDAQPPQLDVELPPRASASEFQSMVDRIADEPSGADLKLWDGWPS